MLSLKAVAGLVLICFVALSFPPFLNALGSESSPSQVVQHWIRVYPKDLNTAVTLTNAVVAIGPPSLPSRLSIVARDGRVLPS